MNLYETYISGKTKEVYLAIESLGDNAFLPEFFLDIEKVLTETFNRVKYNLDVIYTELKSLDYSFEDDINNYQKSLHPPLKNTDELLVLLDETVKEYGYIPLSLKLFYKIVGGVNFSWNFKISEQVLWNLADPVQISSIDSVIHEVRNEFWNDDMKSYVEDEDFGTAFIILSGDDLHKDNISGGEPYSIEITKQKSIDGRFLNEANNTTFINYLRIVFENCGFSGNPNEKTYQEFKKRVLPKLKSI